MDNNRSNIVLFDFYLNVSQRLNTYSRKRQVNENEFIVYRSTYNLYLSKLSSQIIVFMFIATIQNC